MALNLKVKIKNLGKINDAEIELNSITIFAGLNNIGKSYVSKFLYSFLDTLNLDIGHTYFESMIKELRGKVSRIARQPFSLHRNSKKETEIWKAYDNIWELESEINGIQRNLRVLLVDTPTDEMINKLDEIANEKLVLMKKELTNIQNEMSKVESKIRQVTNDKYADNFIVNLNESQEIIQKIIDYKNIYTDEDAIRKTYESSLTYNLTHNFQMSDVSQLIGKDTNNPAIVEIGSSDNSYGKITCTINPNSEVTLDYGNGAPLFSILREHFSRVIYLESPVYWKLENALKRVRNYISPRFRSDDEGTFLSGVPKYFNDLVEAMQPTRTGKPSISLDNLAEEVGGKIIREDGRTLVYQDSKSGKKYTLPLTATGVVQLAFLEHLVATQVIKKDSVVFFDEPEAHLHPAWQIIMMKSLFNLAKQDVNIIFASHSSDNMQWLRNRLQKDSDLNKFVGINHFKIGGDIKLDADKNITCDSILEELTESFAEEFYKSV